MAADLQGDVAFVTGAGSGFGLALSKEIVSKGGSVIMLDITDCTREASELNEKAGKTVAIAKTVDTTSWEQQAAAYEAAKEIFGRVDYFFANAGIAERQWLPNFDPDTAAGRPISKPNMLTLDIDLTGQLYTAALALQVFERQTPNKHGFRGKLVMTASVYGFFPSSIMPLYPTAKAGVVNFTRSAALLYKDKGITVNCIAPNMTATNLAPTADFLAPFQKRNLLGSIDLVIQQFISLLGESKDTGRSIITSGEEAWDQPMDTHKYESCKDGMDLIDSQMTAIFAGK